MFRLASLKFTVSKVVQNNNRLARDAFKLSKKLKDVRQTAGQVEELKKYVQNKSKQEIAGKIDQMSKNQEELRDYINKFNQDHSKRINILDISSYVREYKDLNQPGLKKHQLQLLDEFRKRRTDIRSQEVLSKVVDDLYAVGDHQSQGIEDPALFEQSLNNYELREPFAESHGAKSEKKQIDEFIQLDKYIGHNVAQGSNEFTKLQYDEINVDLADDDRKSYFRQGTFDIHDTFICLVLHRDSTTKVTTLNRINTSRTIVFMGNGTGLMAYGRGRGKSYRQALVRAVYQCKKNIIAIPIDPVLCVPNELYAHFQDYKITLRPARTFNPWGHPVFATMLSTAGIFDCAFKTVHTDKNHYNVVNGLFKVATKNKTPQQISEKEGRKIYRKQWIKPIPFDAAHMHKAVIR